MEDLVNINWESQIPEEEIVKVEGKTILYNVKNRNEKIKLPWWLRSPWEKLTRGQVITIKYYALDRRYVSKDGKLMSEYIIKEINLTPYVLFFSFSLNTLLSFF